MHPVLFTVPGWFFKLVVPAMLLGGLYAFAAPYARRFRARRAGVVPAGAPTAEPAEGVGEGDDPADDLLSDLRINALLALVTAVGLFVFVAPVRVGPGDLVERAVLALLAFARGLFDRGVWTAPWQSLPVYAYGALLTLSLIVGWKITLGLAERQGMPRDRMADCYVVTAIAAVLGSRVLYVITNLDEFRDPETRRVLWHTLFSVRSGGLVAYGGFLGGLAGSLAFLRYHRASFWKWSDAAVPSLASGLTLTRIGCYLFGCDFGKPLSPDAPRFLKRLGTFPHWPDHAGAPAWQQHVTLGFRVPEARCLEYHHGDFHNGLCYLEAGAPASAPVHPTQLYESLTGAMIFLVLVWLWKRRTFEGQIFLAFGVLYGLARSGLEIIRDDHERGFYLGLSTSQLIGLTTAAACAVLYARRSRGARAKPATGVARL